MNQPADDEARGLLETGGAEALAELFDRHRLRLREAVQLRLHAGLRGRLDPSDVIQEAYLEAQERLPEYLSSGKGSPYLWIRFLTLQRLQILHRRHLDAKQRDARREVSLRQGSSPEASSLYPASALIDSQLTASKELQIAERAKQLQEALERLDPGEREVLALRHFEQLTNPEVAHVLGVSEGAASQRYYRALKKLKTILSEFP